MLNMRRAVSVALLLIVAACGGHGASTPPVGGTAGTAGGTAPATVSATVSTVPEVQPALGIEQEPVAGVEGSAGDRFDEAGLVARRGSGFVSLDDPQMVPASQVTWLGDDDVVMGIVGAGGETQAYPVNQMAYHHIANTTVAGEPYLVTY